MKKHLSAFWFMYVFLVWTLFSMCALAQVASPSPSALPIIGDQASSGQVFDMLLQFIISGKYVMAAGAGVMLVTALFKQFALPKLNLGNGVLPYVSLGLGILVGIASSLVAGAPVGEAIKIALLSGPAASQLWSSIFKLVVKKQA